MSKRREQLRSRYIRTFPDKIARSDGLAEALARGQAVEEEARRLCHQIHGSGGTYRFPSLSDVAALAENASRAALPGALTRLADELRVLHDRHAAEAVDDNEG